MDDVVDELDDDCYEEAAGAADTVELLLFTTLLTIFLLILFVELTFLEILLIALDTDDLLELTDLELLLALEELATLLTLAAEASDLAT